MISFQCDSIQDAAAYWAVLVDLTGLRSHLDGDQKWIVHAKRITFPNSHGLSHLILNLGLIERANGTLTLELRDV